MPRYSELRGRRLRLYEAALERLVATRSGAWLFVHVVCHIDRLLLPITGGRVSLAVGTPVGLLETVGARSGRVRRAPLLYLRDGEDVIIVASNGGSARDPAWLHNVRAAPDVRFLSAPGGWRRYRARIEAGHSREAYWHRVRDLFAGYQAYERRTGGREIPIVVLTPWAIGQRAREDSDL